MKKFKVNQVYSMRSACDHECVWRYKVVSRTEGTVVLRQIKSDGTQYDDTARFRINRKLSNLFGAEAIKPLGSYSMAPTLMAK